MATLKELRAKYNAEKLLVIFNQAIGETREAALELLRSQLSEGKKADGSMPNYTSKSYAAYKQRMGSEAPFGVIDLRLTGSFHEKMFLKRTARGFNIRSSDSKNKMLLAKYGSEVYELNEENLSIYVQKYLLPTIQRKLR